MASDASRIAHCTYFLYFISRRKHLIFLFISFPHLRQALGLASLVLPHIEMRMKWKACERQMFNR